jgi:hypothetical protein
MNALPLQTSTESVPTNLVKELEATLGLEADLESKLAKLGELSNKHGLKVSELQLTLKVNKKTVLADLLANKKAALTNLNLEKKIHKKELKVEVKGILAQVKAQIVITKEVESARKLLQKKLDASTRALSMFQGAFETAKRKISELSCDIMLVAKSKYSLKENVKVLNKTNQDSQE